jgi:hypothetical protein
MSADAVHNPTLTDSDVPLAPATRHFPTPPPQQPKLKEQTRETLSHPKSTSIAESITCPILNGEDQAKIPFEHVTKTPIKNATFAPQNAPFMPARLAFYRPSLGSPIFLDVPETRIDLVSTLQ